MPIPAALIAGIGAAGAATGGLISGITGAVQARKYRELSEREVAALKNYYAKNPYEVYTPEWSAEYGPQEIESALTRPDIGRAAQERALARLAQVSREGYTAEERNAMEAIARQTQQQEQAARMALEQQYAARGVGGAGAQIAAQMAAQQGAAERQSMLGGQVAADAQRRALQALSESAQVGGQMSAADIDRARAIEMVKQFNAAQREAAAIRKAQFAREAATAREARQAEDWNRRMSLARLAMGQASASEESAAQRGREGFARAGSALQSGAQAISSLWG